ncbi:uridine kinase [Acetoanaerobium pronyense]|uniref:Uridine kinase n=1 Tax=Acetoanaerobium pronyense TaxID=1482736 RepID=A0ABS4KIG1_9FIRM|nr:nucleoside kinase [Acetoanaerobium pronyense]MBP2027582.1 uridine kinase [Acetoanaerobium pronyense]
MSLITVRIGENDMKFNSGITLEEILEYDEIKLNLDYPVTLALVDNNLRELRYRLEHDCEVKFIDISDKDGRRTYMRSLTFLFIRAIEELYPNSNVKIQHSLSNGFYCEVDSSKKFTILDVNKVENRMRDFIDQDEKIIRFKTSKKDAIDIYKKQNRVGKADLLKYKNTEDLHLYRCGWLEDYFYGYMVPSSNMLKVFSLRLYNEGIVLLGPDIKNPKTVTKFIHQPNLFKIYKEAKSWADVLSIPNAASLNDAIENGSIPEVIRLAEAYHEKKICDISNMINNDKEKGKLILIAGPSSSGKTSFAQRLKLQLMVNKMRPVSISVDDYFVNREDTPLDEFGEKDYESVYAIDLNTFNEDLEKLISGYEINLPTFNFKTGAREYTKDKRISIEENQPIIIEGIHGLNPVLTQSIPEGNKFKIYISALTQLNLDEHNKISTTDIRLIRRIVRDFEHRSYTANDTIRMWKSVNRGEEKNIFPFQENSDIMFNSALIYEIGVLKKYVEPLLNKISIKDEEYREAKRLLKFLQYFLSIDDESDIPNTSLLREFIGGSKIVH